MDEVRILVTAFSAP